MVEEIDCYLDHFLGFFQFLEFLDKAGSDIGVEVTIRVLAAIGTSELKDNGILVDFAGAGEGGVMEEFALFVAGVFLEEVIEHPEGFVGAAGLGEIACASYEEFVAKGGKFAQLGEGLFEYFDFLF